MSFSFLFHIFLFPMPFFAFLPCKNRNTIRTDLFYAKSISNQCWLFLWILRGSIVSHKNSVIDLNHSLNHFTIHQWKYLIFQWPTSVPNTRRTCNSSADFPPSFIAVAFLRNKTLCGRRLNLGCTKPCKEEMIVLKQKQKNFKKSDLGKLAYIYFSVEKECFFIKLAS